MNINHLAICAFRNLVFCLLAAGFVTSLQAQVAIHGKQVTPRGSFIHWGGADDVVILRVDIAKSPPLPIDWSVGGELTGRGYTNTDLTNRASQPGVSVLPTNKAIKGSLYLTEANTAPAQKGNTRYELWLARDTTGPIDGTYAWYLDRTLTVDPQGNTVVAPWVFSQDIYARNRSLVGTLYTAIANTTSNLTITYEGENTFFGEGVGLYNFGFLNNGIFNEFPWLHTDKRSAFPTDAHMATRSLRETPPTFPTVSLLDSVSNFQSPVLVDFPFATTVLSTNNVSYFFRYKTLTSNVSRHNLPTEDSIAVVSQAVYPSNTATTPPYASTATTPPYAPHAEIPMSAETFQLQPNLRVVSVLPPSFTTKNISMYIYKFGVFSVSYENKDGDDCSVPTTQIEGANIPDINIFLKGIDMYPQITVMSLLLMKPHGGDSNYKGIDVQFASFGSHLNYIPINASGGTLGSSESIKSPLGRNKLLGLNLREKLVPDADYILRFFVSTPYSTTSLMRASINSSLGTTNSFTPIDDITGVYPGQAADGNFGRNLAAALTSHSVGGWVKLDDLDTQFSVTPPEIVVGPPSSFGPDVMPAATIVTDR